MPIWWLTAATVGSGHPMSLCGFDKDGDLCFSSVYGPRAAVAMPSQTCRHLRLDKQAAGGGGRRILLTSPLPLAPPLPPYQVPSMPTVGQVCDRLADSPPAYSDTADKAFCMKWPRCDSCFKFIRSSSGINIRVNYEGLIYS